MYIIISIFLILILFFGIKIQMGNATIEIYALKRFFKKKNIEKESLDLEEEINRIIKYDFTK